jgi:hypothetical protein
VERFAEEKKQNPEGKTDHAEMKAISRPFDGDQILYQRDEEEGSCSNSDAFETVGCAPSIFKPMGDFPFLID